MAFFPHFLYQIFTKKIDAKPLSVAILRGTVSQRRKRPQAFIRLETLPPPSRQ
jgi:hypothetical protein